MGQAFLDPGAELSYEVRAALYAAAAEHGLTEVTSLFLSPPPLKAWTPPRDPPDARLAHLSLGHKKALARVQKDPDLLARLAAEGAPEVVRELLQNPQLTEPFAVRIAARRPCRPETLRLLAESRRWRTQPAVAMAVARNPYTEPAVSLKLLGFLAKANLQDLGRDGKVHPLVQALAQRLGRTRGRVIGGTPASTSTVRPRAARAGAWARALARAGAGRWRRPSAGIFMAPRTRRTTRTVTASSAIEGLHGEALRAVGYRPAAAAARAPSRGVLPPHA